MSKYATDSDRNSQSPPSINTDSSGEFKGAKVDLFRAESPREVQELNEMLSLSPSRHS
jgi:hypothetical protein